MKSITIPALLGPTAVGKTEIAMRLCRELGFEIISCDSRQIYRYMDIGTAKPSVALMREIRHHCVDSIDPDKPYSAFAFSRDALSVLNQALTEDKKYLICGGTGLYYRSLSEGLSARIESDERLRDEIMKRAKEEGIGPLHEELRQKDPRSASKIHVNDLQRIARALLVYYQTGTPISSYKGRVPLSENIHFSAVILTTDREELYGRIDTRVDRMVKEGLYDEFRSLLRRGYDKSSPGMKCVGYKEFFGVERDTAGFNEAVETVKRNTRRYAKRQITWFSHQVSDAVVEDASSYGRIRERIMRIAGM
jgi:tRNA dimethylallyltransferase